MVDWVSPAAGAAGFFFGVAIGYYRAKYEMSREFVTRDDCEKCQVRIDVAKALSDLKTGTARFETTSRDIALIKQYLEMEREKQHDSILG